MLVSQVWAQAVDARSDAKRIEEPRRTIVNECMYSNAIDQIEVYILLKTKEVENGCSDVRKKKPENESEASWTTAVQLLYLTMLVLVSRPLAT